MALLYASFALSPCPCQSRSRLTEFQACSAFARVQEPKRFVTSACMARSFSPALFQPNQWTCSTRLRASSCGPTPVVHSHVAPLHGCRRFRSRVRGVEASVTPPFPDRVGIARHPSLAIRPGSSLESLQFRSRMCARAPVPMQLACCLDFSRRSAANSEPVGSTRVPFGSSARSIGGRLRSQWAMLGDRVSRRRQSCQSSGAKR